MTEGVSFDDPASVVRAIRDAGEAWQPLIDALSKVVDTATTAPQESAARPEQWCASRAQKALADMGWKAMDG